MKSMPLLRSFPVRMPRPRATALALALAPLWSLAAEPIESVEQQLKRVLQRLHTLEVRNAELERRVQELGSARAAAPVSTPVAAGDASWGAARDARLQALEAQVQELGQPEAMEVSANDGGSEGPVVEGTLVGVWQGVNRGGSADGRAQNRLSFRGDIGIELPAGEIGDAQGTLVGQLRFGQGEGIALRPTHTGAVNSTAFEASAGSDDTYAIVAQAYYRLDIPLDQGRFNDQPGTRLTFNVGKMDFFGQFDQNAVAADEAGQFLNNVFVHNPLLDSGGDIGADAYGFAPGATAAYYHEGESWGWGVSLGAFAAGDGATFNGGLGRPLVIVQAEVSPKQLNGEPRGTYRVYAWTNGRTTDLDGLEERHTGFGLSLDQKVGADWNLFGRYGKRTSGSGTFDEALTLGFEHGGRLWGRRNDAVGLAYGLLDTSREYRRYTADTTAVGYAAHGREQLLELYYRVQLNDQFALAPDFQLIRRPGGDGGTSNTRVFGVRGTLGF